MSKAKKTYKIKTDGHIVTVFERDTRTVLAEYNVGEPRRFVAAMRRLIDGHLVGGGTLGNYQL
jgi:hypothetical protein